MHNWRLLLLAFLAVLQPIVSFTERNLFDGREKCCDRDSLFRESRFSYDINYNNLPEDRRLSRAREDQRHEVRGERLILARTSTERRLVKRLHRDDTRFSIEQARVIRSDIHRGNIADNRREQFSTLRDDRQWRTRDTQRTFASDIDRHPRERDISHLWYSRESDIRPQDRNMQKSSSVRPSRHDSSIFRDVSNERRFKISMGTRQETRPNSDVSKERRVQERRETREILQRTGHDVVRREIFGAKQDRHVVRERMGERSEQAKFRLQQENREPLSLDRRVREVSNDRRSTSVNHVRKSGEERGLSIRDTSDERQRFSNRFMVQQRDDRRAFRYGTMSARRESRHATLSASREADKSRNRSTDARELRESTFRNTETKVPRDRILEVRRETRESRNRSSEARKEVQDQTLETRRQIRDSRYRTLDTRKEVRGTRDRALEARRQVKDVRLQNSEARKEVREVRDSTIETRVFRERSLDARKEARESKDKTLEALLEVRYARDRMSIEARKESRESRDKTLEAPKESRGFRVARDVRVSTLETRRETRESRDRTLEARKKAWDAHVRNSRDTPSIKARTETRKSRDRTSDAKRVSRVSREAWDIRASTLEARRETRVARDRTLAPRREVRDVRIRNAEARKETRETRDIIVDDPREVRLSKDRYLDARKVDNQKERVNSREEFRTLTRGVETKSITERESRSIVREHRNQPEFRSFRGFRMIRSFETRERDVSRTRIEIRDGKTTESGSRYRYSTEFSRSREIFATKTQSDNQLTAMNWQYLFYTLQGIYLCSILMQMLSQKESNKKPGTLTWLTSPRSLVKTD